MSLERREERWRQILGRQLLAEMLDRLRSKGCEQATVWAFAESHGARRLYASFGFVPDGTEARHDASDQPTVRLAASLAEIASDWIRLRSGLHPSRDRGGAVGTSITRAGGPQSEGTLSSQ